jgi:hypothetical protein
MGRLLRPRRPAPRGRGRRRGRRPPLRAVRPRLPPGPDRRPAGAGRRRGAGRRHARRHASVLQRPPAPAGADRARSALRQPAGPRGPRACPGAGPAQRAPRRPLRRGRAGHDTRSPPCHRGAPAPPGRRQRRGGARRRPGGRRHRPWRTHPGLGGGPRLPPAARGAGACRAGLCHPDLPAAPRRPRRRPGGPAGRHPPGIHGPGRSRCSRATGGW